MDSDSCSFFRTIQREGPLLCDGPWHVVWAVECGNRSRGDLFFGAGKEATSGPSRNPSPHYSIHEAEAPRAPLGMNERVPPLLVIRSFPPPPPAQILISLSSIMEVVSLLLESLDSAAVFLKS